MFLTLLKEDSPLLLYLSGTEREMSLVIFQEIDKAERLVYFLSNVFKGAETHY